MQLTFVGCGDAFGSGGRYNTCLHLTGAGLDWLIDIGASSYLGLREAGLDLSAIGTILITHFHGDHFGGLPFFVLDGLFVRPRQRDLTLIGPRGIEARTRAVMEAMFPGYFDLPRDFRILFREIMPGETLAHDGTSITAHQMVHDPKVGPCNGYRIEAGGRSIAFTGDTAWTEAIVPLARDADLFICDCYSFDRETPVHLSYKTLSHHRDRIGARRIVLTHMGEDMLAARAKIVEECAQDGLTITIP